MAKKIRFPLMMKDGTAVRTLEELREHFDLESVLGYFADGKLKTWLADRYYDEKAQKIAELTAGMPDLNAKLCEILGVDYSAESDDIDFEYLQKRQKKLNALKMITDDQTILEKVDAVAFDQDELFDILDEAPAKIYLCGEQFSIPYWYKYGDCGLDKDITKAIEWYKKAYANGAAYAKDLLSELGVYV